MSERMWPRLGAACGLLYIVFVFGGATAGIEALAAIELVGLILFVPFLGYLWSVLRAAEGPGGWLAATAFGAGLVDTTIKLGSAAPSLASRNLPEGSAIDLALHDINNASFILTMYPLAVLVGAVAILAFRTEVLPRWHAWLGAVTAAALLVNGFFLEADFGPAFLLFLLWTVLTSGILLARLWTRTSVVQLEPAPAR